MTVNMQQLEESFDTWFAMINRVLDKPVPKQPLSENALTVGGYDLAGLKKLIQDILDEHMNIPNEHRLTLEQLGAMSKDDILFHLSNYQNKHHLPLTSLTNLQSRSSVNWDTRVVSVTAGQKFIYLGEEYTLPAMSVTRAAVNLQTVALKITGGYKTKTFTLDAMETSGRTSSLGLIPFMDVNLAAKTFTCRAVTRILNHELSTTPRGRSIPITARVTQANGARLTNSWYTD